MTTNQIVNKTIAINAQPPIVWDTLTNPQLMKLWLSEEEVNIISDFKVGNAIILAGKWHEIEYENKGTVLKFETERIFAFNHWSKLDRLADKPENYSVIEFLLTPKENQTILSVTHSNIANEATYGHSNFYWTVRLHIIKKLIEKS